MPRLVILVDCRDDDGWTPLHAAVYWENMEAAEMLVTRGAKINMVTKTVSIYMYTCMYLYMYIVYMYMYVYV